jgi:N-acyl-L-homoserine lactone synthetase
MSGVNTVSVVSPGNKHLYKRDLEEFFKLRKDVLIDQRGWELKYDNGMEIDQFDHDYAHYLFYKCFYTGRVLGGVRLTPSMAPNLTMDIFSNLIDPSYNFKRSPYVWESSRYVTTTCDKRLQKGLIREITLVLFISMIEFCLRKGVHALLMLTEIRLERIGRMVGWHLNRLGKVQRVGNTYAVVGLAGISESTRKAVRNNAGISRSVFWEENLHASNNDSAKAKTFDNRA